MFKAAYHLCGSIIEKPYLFTDGKATNVVTPVSLLEIKVTLPSRIIFSCETNCSKYDPSELAHSPNVKLGGGILGPLFKVVLNSGSIVAVRRFRKGIVKPTELDNCIGFFSQINGRLLLAILFSFWYGEEAFVAYRYLCLGSLEELLHGREGIQFTPLNWEIRCHIALCASLAVASIHSQVSKEGEPLVCGVIKASNILIQVDFSACLGGYETPYLIPSHVLIKRNPGSVAPELIDSEKSSDVFTQKSDVYSFGILLLQLITGKKPMLCDGHREVMLVDYVKFKKKEVGMQGIYDEKLLEVEDSITNIVEIAELCLLQNPNERPTMDRVVQMFQELQHKYSNAHTMKVCLINSTCLKPVYVFDIFFKDSAVVEQHCNYFLSFRKISTVLL
ncbi:Leucine-rich repeat receptor-like protein kinase pxc1 [Thalictrum thalictroides]|uniref:Leucine-rich repeat receptor-like protein kinase pxc1 n=1 Tax=Thalictrum thalictroides TaxID=46969 RepID=A0A7J6VTD3_THATH|nr:Leucine-rich repeat receptor-like protein kinase pxc1 [Thalictrum thalictroides]